jgi:hypothetical protein
VLLNIISVKRCSRSFYRENATTTLILLFTLKMNARICWRAYPHSRRSTCFILPRRPVYRLAPSILSQEENEVDARHKEQVRTLLGRRLTARLKSSGPLAKTFLASARGRSVHSGDAQEGTRKRAYIKRKEHLSRERTHYIEQVAKPSSDQK